MHAKCPTLCNPLDCSLPDSSVCGIFQTRILEWITFSSPGNIPDPGSNQHHSCIGDSLPLNHLGSTVCNLSVQSLGCARLFETLWTAARQASLSFTNSRSLLNSCPSSQRCHPTISSSVIPFSHCVPLSWILMRNVY